MENEALRSALSVKQPEHGPEFQSAPPPVQPVQMPQYQADASRAKDPEARRIAVERYRQKKKRRLESQTPNGPRYVKMKAVADGKQRSSSGKFVKKGDQVLVVSDEAAMNLAIPQICEVVISPRVGEATQQ